MFSSRCALLSPPTQPPDTGSSSIRIPTARTCNNPAPRNASTLSSTHAWQFHTIETTSTGRAWRRRWARLTSLQDTHPTTTHSTRFQWPRHAQQIVFAGWTEEYRQGCDRASVCWTSLAVSSCEAGSRYCWWRRRTKRRSWSVPSVRCCVSKSP